MPATETWHERCRKLATTIRAHSLRMTHHGKSGHVGSMLSMAEILAVLYERILKVDPARPKWPDRDRMILSKGHGGGAVYAVLAEKGFFPKDWLMTYYCDRGKLMGHISHHVPGVEFSTGSLGHGRRDPHDDQPAQEQEQGQTAGHLRRVSARVRGGRTDHQRIQ